MFSLSFLIISILLGGLWCFHTVMVRVTDRPASPSLSFSFKSSSLMTPFSPNPTSTMVTINIFSRSWTCLVHWGVSASFSLLSSIHHHRHHTVLCIWPCKLGNQWSKQLSQLPQPLLTHSWWWWWGFQWHWIQSRPKLNFITLTKKTDIVEYSFIPLAKVPIFGCPKMGLQVPESKNWDHFFTPTSPQNGGVGVCFIHLPLLDA